MNPTFKWLFHPFPKQNWKKKIFAVRCQNVWTNHNIIIFIEDDHKSQREPSPSLAQNYETHLYFSSTKSKTPEELVSLKISLCYQIRIMSGIHYVKFVAAAVCSAGRSIPFTERSLTGSWGLPQECAGKHKYNRTQELIKIISPISNKLQAEVW